MTPDEPTEPRVNESACRSLLAIGTETETLDYKATLDLSSRSPKDLIELTKDLGAMMPLGGHILIGADSYGKLVPGQGVQPGQAELFDESRLRARVTKYLGTDFRLYSAVHHIDGTEVALIQVMPHPDGYVAFAANGDYTINGKATTVFREGEIYVRVGTSSVRASKHHMDRLIRDQRATAPSPTAPITTKPTVDMDLTEFEDAVATAGETPGALAIQQFAHRAGQQASDLDVNASNAPDLLLPIVDHLAYMAALGLRWKRDDLVTLSIEQLHHTYMRGIDSSGLAAGLSRIRWVNLVANRAYAIGAEAVRSRAWAVIPTLVFQPSGTIPAKAWQDTWLHSARLWRAKHIDRNPTMLHGRRVENRSHLEYVLDDICGQRWTNPHSPYQDPLRKHLTQFDALASISINIRARRDGEHHGYFPSYRAYDAADFEPAIVAVLQDELLNAVVGATSDKEMAAALRGELDIGADNLAMLGGASGYADPRVVQYINRHDRAK